MADKEYMAVGHLVVEKKITGEGIDEFSSAPGFGQVMIQSSGKLKAFNFLANGSDERSKLVSIYQYMADELAAGRKVAALAGVGDYGFDGNGIKQEFLAGSQGLSIGGMGRSQTRIGYVGDALSGSNWHVLKCEPDVTPLKDIVSITQAAGVATVTLGLGHGAEVGETIRIYENRVRGKHDAGTSATVLTDTSAGKKSGGYDILALNELVGMVITNKTDKASGTYSSGVITGNTASDASGVTITVSALTGGSDQQWESGDFYTVESPTPEYFGLHMVTGVTDTEVTFNIDSGATSPCVGFGKIAIHSQFLRDFTFSNIGVIDTNPAAHSGASGEETHGLGLDYAKNLTINNFGSTGIGDESIELVWVEGFKVKGIHSYLTPTEELTGGGVISIKNGCHNGLVDGFSLNNLTDRLPSNASDNTYAVNFKNVVHPEYSDNIKVMNGFIEGMVTAGIRFNTGTADITNIDIDNVNITGGEYGVTQGGSNHALSVIKFNKVKMVDQWGTPFDIDRALGDASDIELHNSLMDGRFSTNANSTCAVVGGDGYLLKDNHYKNTKIGIIGTANSNDVKVRGGTIEKCGGTGTTYAQYAYDQSPALNMSVDGTKVKNGVAVTVGFRNVGTIKHVEFENCLQPANWAAQGVKVFDHNINVPHNVQLDEGNSCCNNNFTHSGSGGNGCIRLVDSLHAIVMGNKAPLLTGDAIEGQGTTDYCVVVGNTMNGRPVNAIGVNSTSGNNI